MALESGSSYGVAVVTKQANLTAIIQSRRLTIFGTLHVWMMTQTPR